MTLSSRSLKADKFYPMLRRRRRSLSRLPDFRRVLLAAGLQFGAMGLAADTEEVAEQFRQSFTETYEIRKERHAALLTYFDAVREESDRQVSAAFRQDFSSPAAYERSLEPFRRAMRSALAIPPPRALEQPSVRLEKVGEDKYATIYRAWLTLIEGVELYSLYMLPKSLTGKAPLIVAQHGGGGCPEAICDLDTRINYDSFGPKAVRRGYIVWAPYSVMAVPYAGDSSEAINRQTLQNRAAAAGTDLRGLEVYQIARGVEALASARPEVDEHRIGMTGLSYGGSMTITTMALTPMIKVGVAAAGFRDTPRRSGVGSVAQAAAICPRPLMIQSGDADDVTKMETVLPGIPKVAAFYEKIGMPDRFVFDRHPGGHVFVTGAVLDFFDQHLK